MKIKEIQEFEINWAEDFEEFLRKIGLGDALDRLDRPLKPFDLNTIKRPTLVNPSGKRTGLKTKDSRWLFDDPKYPLAYGYLPIWHYIPKKGFVDAHEGAKYYGLLDGKNAVDQDVLDKSNRNLELVIKTMQKSREKRMQKENKTMKITKEQLTNIIKEEVEKALEERMSQEEYADWADKNGIKLKLVQDKDDNLLMVPVSKPKLPKNWRTLKFSDPNRYWFRMWYKHGKKPAVDAPAKVQKDKNELPRGDFELPPAKKLPSEEDALKNLIVKRGSMPKPPTKKPRGIGSGKGGKLKYSDLNPFKDLKLRGKPILVNKDGKRTSLKTKDSQWKFRDGTIIPIYNYIPGRGRVDDEEGLKYYGFSSKKKVKDNVGAATSTQKVPTEGEFLRSALERAKKGEQGEGWWGKDTRFRGNLNLWRNSMQQKYRNNIEKFKASLK